MFNPNRDVDRARLSRAVDQSRKMLEPFRRNRYELLKEFVGSFYSEEHARLPVYVNLLNQLAEAYTLALAANRPRVLCTTRYPHYSSFARRFEINVNNLVEQIELETTLQDMILGAFFSVGIVKVVLGNSASVMHDDDLRSDPGRPFASKISLDNWFHDMSACAWERTKFEGDFWEAEQSKLLGDDAFDQAVVKELAPASRTTNRDGEDAAKELTLTQDSDDVYLEPMIELADVYIPGVGLCTFDRKFEHKPLAVREDIDECCYEKLQFIKVEDNTMGVSPAANVRLLHELYNSLMRKQAVQARQQRDIPTFAGGAEEDAKRLQKAKHGEWTRVNDPERIKIMKMGGVDPGNAMFSQGVMDLFDRMGGNLRAKMGLGPQSPTATQDEMISSQVSEQEAQLQYKVVRATDRICGKLGDLMWKDPISRFEGYESLEAFPTIQAPADIEPWERIGDRRDYLIKIEPYSMAYQSPSQRANVLRQNVAEFAQMSELLMQQGGSIDMEEYRNAMSELQDSPHLKKIIRFGEVIEEGPPEPDESGMKSSTTRNYVRRSVPASASPQGRQNQQMSQMMELAAAQNSE